MTSITQIQAYIQASNDDDSDLVLSPKVHTIQLPRHRVNEQKASLLIPDVSIPFLFSLFFMYFIIMI